MDLRSDAFSVALAAGGCSRGSLRRAGSEGCYTYSTTRCCGAPAPRASAAPLAFTVDDAQGASSDEARAGAT